MDLIQQIKTAVLRGDFIISAHARQRMSERSVRLWQIETGLDDADVIEVRLKSRPNPSIVALETLPDGTEVKVVWSWLRRMQQAKLVTVHYLDFAGDP